MIVVRRPARCGAENCDDIGTRLPGRVSINAAEILSRDAHRWPIYLSGGVSARPSPGAAFGRSAPRSSPGGSPCGKRAYGRRTAPSTDSTRGSLDTDALVVVPTMTHTGSDRTRNQPCDRAETPPSALHVVIASNRAS